jgi:hypothetical protein
MGVNRALAVSKIISHKIQENQVIQEAQGNP